MGIFICIELLFIIIYIKKCTLDIKWNIEKENVKFRTLFDRIPKCDNTLNRCYNLIYIISKILISVALVFELEIMGKVIITAFPVLFIIHDII